MDMPPSGWYPDPYGVRGLLRWWDGSVWTEYTQSQDSPPVGEETSLDLPPAVERTALDIPPAAQRTALDLPPATSLDIPPSAAERTAVDLPPVTAGFGPPGNATQMFASEDFAGYARIQRQRQIRRRLIMAALAAGTAVILVLIVMALMRFGKQPNKPVSLTTRPSATRTTQPPSPSPSPSVSAATLSDTSSGLSYTQFGSPWQATCPSGLDQQGFGWSAGESAVAGTVTVNGQQTNWYGNACSGLLPSQYGYTSVADLSSTTSTLAGTFENTFYNGMQHTVSQLVSTPMSISGHAAWEVKFLITYTDPSSVGANWTTEEGAVVVADRNPGNEPAVFYASVPSNLGVTNIDSLVSSLTLNAPAASSTATASPSASPTASVTATATATANPGGGNGGGGGGNGGGGGGNGGGGGGGF
jgi:hypothetical protein